MKIELTREQYRKLIVLAHLGEHMINTPPEEENEDDDARELLTHLNAHAKDFDSEDLLARAEDEKYYGTRLLNETTFKFIEEYDDDMFWNDLALHLAMRDLEDEEFGSDEEREEAIHGRAEHYITEFEKNGTGKFKVGNLILAIKLAPAGDTRGRRNPGTQSNHRHGGPEGHQVPE